MKKFIKGQRKFLLGFNLKVVYSKDNVPSYLSLLESIVLEPAYETAFSLSPIKAELNPNWIKEFLENYQEERGWI